MKSLRCLLLAVAVCSVLIDARQHGERPADQVEQDEHSSGGNDFIQKHHNQARHRRKRWQMDYGYQPQAYQRFYEEPDRRDNTIHRHDQQIQDIYRMLQDIQDYIRRPQTPQPIYVPYPVQYVHVPQQCHCNKKPYVPNKVNLTDRFPEMEDSNQNWGYDVPPRHLNPNNIDQSEDFGDYQDNIRPINFDPVLPKRPITRTQPKVDHGSTQAAAKRESRTSTAEAEAEDTTCHAMSVICCNPRKSEEQQYKCFIDVGCDQYFRGGDACSNDNITAAMNVLKRSYSPTSQN